MGRVFKVIAILLVGLTSSLVVVQYFNKYIYKPRATGPTLSFVFSPSSGSVALNQEKEIVLTVSSNAPENKLAGLDISIITEGKATISRIGTLSIPNASTSSAVLFTETKKEISTTGARLGYVSLEQGAELPTVVQLRIYIKATADGTGKIKVDIANTQIVGVESSPYSNGTGGEANFIFGAGLPTPTKAPTPTPIKIVPIPTPALIKSGSPKITLDVRDHRGKRIAGVLLGRADCDANADSKRVCDFSYRSGTINPLSFPKGSPKHEFIGGLIRVDPKKWKLYKIYTNLPRPSVIKGCHGKGADYTCPVWLAKNFTGGTRIIIFQLIPVIQAPTVVPTKPPVPTIIGVPPAGAVTLNIKLRFQGIVGPERLAQLKERGVKMPIKLILDGGALTSPIEQTINFIPDSLTANQGVIWSGTANFNISPLSNYILKIKGPRHIQKRLCDNSPQETAPGTYSCSDGKISLKTGVSILDLSGITLLVGDLPDQDGIVNAADIALIRNSLSTEDQSVIDKADLNFDGRLNTQDYALIIGALSIRSDEE